MGGVFTSFSSEAHLEQWMAPLVEGFGVGLVRTAADYGTFTMLKKISKEILDNSPGGEDFIMPTERADALQVWDNVQPHVNNWRFMVYIVWLSEQPDSFVKFCHVKKERKETYQACFKRLIDHVKTVQRIEDPAVAGTV